MRYAYADPPYLGQAKFYRDRTDWQRWDSPEAHADLIAQLSADFPDGWALSLHTPSLRTILPMCPEDVRVMAWVKPFASFKPGVNPAYAWKKMIVRGGRRRTDKSEPTERDYVAAGITLRRGFVGAKPPQFCHWLFAVLGLRAEDEFVDLFPGSGAVSAAYDSWRRQRRFA
jgi:hypothetical protein